MNTEFIDKIKINGITTDIINKVIERNLTRIKDSKTKYNRYKGVDVPIFNQKAVKLGDFETGGGVYRIDDKIHNSIANSYDSDIVDTKVGYMYGVPIVYDYDQEDEKLIEHIKNFNLRNMSEDLDSELGKLTTICGYAARLCYIDLEGNERIRNVKPWEVIFFGDNISEPVYAMRYVTDKDNNVKCEFYDSQNIYYFEGQNNSVKFIEQQPHMFTYVPLFGVKNNDELMGDSEKVYTLIDAYDKIVSGAVSEIEAGRLAYLVLKGMGADQETLEQLNKTGVFELIDERMDIKYLTKDVNDSIIMNVLAILDANIAKFAKTVNFNDEAFGGNSSGVAIRYKLMALENKSIVAERKFKTALMYQFKVLFSAWQFRGFNLNDESYLDMYFTFTRNIPVNRLEEAQILTTLQGVVSEDTRLSQSALIDDVDFEKEKLAEETLQYSNTPLEVEEHDNRTGRENSNVQ